MKIIKEAVMGLSPSTYEREEVVLDPGHGLWGEKLRVTTSEGVTYDIRENSEGNLELLVSSHHKAFLHQSPSNVIELVGSPLFAPHKMRES